MTASLCIAGHQAACPNPSIPQAQTLQPHSLLRLKSLDSTSTLRFRSWMGSWGAQRLQLAVCRLMWAAGRAEAQAVVTCLERCRPSFQARCMRITQLGASFANLCRILRKELLSVPAVQQDAPPSTMRVTHGVESSSMNSSGLPATPVGQARHRPSAIGAGAGWQRFRQTVQPPAGCVLNLTCGRGLVGRQHSDASLAVVGCGGGAGQQAALHADVHVADCTAGRAVEVS